MSVIRSRIATTTRKRITQLISTEFISTQYLIRSSSDASAWRLIRLRLTSI